MIAYRLSRPTPRRRAGCLREGAEGPPAVPPPGDRCALAWSQFAPSRAASPCGLPACPARTRNLVTAAPSAEAAGASLAVEGRDDLQWAEAIEEVRLLAAELDALQL